MPVHTFAHLTWDSVQHLAGARPVALLPVGAVEAHGPHLPLGTDVIIAQAMARACAEELSDEGMTALVMPPIWYSAAGFAEAFPGTIDVRPTGVTALIRDIAASLVRHGIGTLAVANAHLDPAHLYSLRSAADHAPDGSTIVFLDLTRRAAASRLTEEFQTGACHAGRFEGSIVRAEAPELFREGVARALPPNPASLSTAIKEGKKTFADAGGPDAYFGWPADATGAEGRNSVRVLGTLLAEAVREALGGTG